MSYESMDSIYSDLRAEVLPNIEIGGYRVQIYDSNGNRYRPNLIIPNSLALERMIKALQDILKQQKKKGDVIG